mgnify:CR=1 FL=1
MVIGTCACFIFFSNVQIPLLLNKTDRRYTVIKVATVHPPEYFAAIDEVDAHDKWTIEPQDDNSILVGLLRRKDIQ